MKSRSISHRRLFASALIPMTIPRSCLLQIDRHTRVQASPVIMCYASRPAVILGGILTTENRTVRIMYLYSDGTDFGTLIPISQ